ncbi:MAG: hypothetical protein GKS06_10700 [Acidobacteria bacterium]|nr:hypothetical protein [Acidobacteriota bacterium]
MPVSRLSALILALIPLAALGWALTVDVAGHKTDGTHTGVHWSDEAAYHIMAHSLAFDGDLEYERRDLQRIYDAGFPGGPSGMFLARNPEDGNLYFSKAWIYSAFAAPLIRLFGDNGFFVMHALLLGLVLVAGFAYARRGNGESIAMLYTLTYVLGSVVALYFFWMTPEWFNASLMFLATFLWLYKVGPPGAEEEASEGWLYGAWTDYAAAALYGIAIFSKPPNGLLLLPLLFWHLLNRRVARAVTCGAVAAVVILGGFAVTDASMGHWNYQGGDRRQFNAVTSYPFLSEGHTFDSVGISMTTNVEDFRAVPPVDTLTRDLVYVWVGRNGGLLLYMFPAVLALLMFAATGERRLRNPHLLLATFFLLEILAIVLVVRGNWIGGGGTVGSRYFANVYPVLFFVIPAGVRPLGAAISWVVWGAFLSQTVITPFASSVRPAQHTKSIPYTAFPTEMTILHNLPFNTSPSARKVALVEPAPFWIYFLDDNTYLREGQLEGFWVNGGQEAEFILRSDVPLTSITLELGNRSALNTVTLRYGSQVQTLEIEPRERATVTLPTDEFQRYIDGPTWLYRIAVAATASTTPSVDTPGADDNRNLGVFVRPTAERADSES